MTHHGLGIIMPPPIVNNHTIIMTHRRCASVSSRVVLEDSKRVVNANWIFGGPSSLIADPEHDHALPTATMTMRYIAAASPPKPQSSSTAPRPASHYYGTWNPSSLATTTQLNMNRQADPFFRMIMEQKAKVVVLLMSAKHSQRQLSSMNAAVTAVRQRQSIYMNRINRMSHSNTGTLKVEDITSSEVKVDGSAAAILRTMKLTDLKTKAEHVFTHILVRQPFGGSLVSMAVVERGNHSITNSWILYAMFVCLCADGMLLAKQSRTMWISLSMPSPRLWLTQKTKARSL